MPHMPPTMHWRIQGGRQGRAPPRGSKFFHFNAVFGKNVKNNSNFGSWRPPLGKILDPPLLCMLPCHACPLPCTPPTTHTPCHVYPPAMHAPHHAFPRHACPLPCMPLPSPRVLLCNNIELEEQVIKDPMSAVNGWIYTLSSL